MRPFSPSILHWCGGNGHRDFESSAYSGSNNVYNYTLIATDDDGNSDSLAVAVTVTDVTESAFTLSGIADSNQAENSAYTSATPARAALPSACSPTHSVAMMRASSPSIPPLVWWKWSLAILKAPPILDPITSTTTHSLPPMTMATQTASLLLSPSPMSPNRPLSHSPESPIPTAEKFRLHIRHSQPERHSHRLRHLHTRWR